MFFYTSLTLLFYCRIFSSFLLYSCRVCFGCFLRPACIFRVFVFHKYFVQQGRPAIQPSTLLRFLFLPDIAVATNRSAIYFRPARGSSCISFRFRRGTGRCVLSSGLPLSGYGFATRFPSRRRLLRLLSARQGCLSGSCND